MSDRSIGTAFIDIHGRVSPAFKSEVVAGASPQLARAGRELSEQARRAAIAQGQLNKNLAEGNRTITQFRRGALAASLSLTGLRGAVLAAGLGFLGGAGIINAMAAFIGLSAEFEKSLNTLGAVTGATAFELELASKRARELGADLTLPKTTAADAAEAMAELARGGLSLEDSMKAVKGTLQLATAAQTDFGTAAKITAKALNSFNLGGEDAIKVVDALANAANASTGEITDMALSMQQAAAVAHQAGLSVEETATSIALLANAGLTGSDAGTSLRTMLLRLTPQSKEAAAAVSDLGVALVDARGNFLPLPAILLKYRDALRQLSPQLRTHFLQQIFGQDAIRAANILINQGAAGFELMRARIEEQGAAAALAASKNKGLAGAFDALASNVQTSFIGIGKGLLPGLTEFVRGINDQVTAMGNSKALQDTLAATTEGLARAFADFARVVQGLAPIMFAFLRVVGAIERAIGPGPIIAAIVAWTQFGKVVKVGQAALTGVGTAFRLFNREGQQAALAIGNFATRSEANAKALVILERQAERVEKAEARMAKQVAASERAAAAAAKQEAALGTRRQTAAASTAQIARSSQAATVASQELAVVEEAEIARKQALAVASEEVAVARQHEALAAQNLARAQSTPGTFVTPAGTPMRSIGAGGFQRATDVDEAQGQLLIATNERIEAEERLDTVRRKAIEEEKLLAQTTQESSQLRTQLTGQTVLFAEGQEKVAESGQLQLLTMEDQIVTETALEVEERKLSAAIAQRAEVQAAAANAAVAAAEREAAANVVLANSGRKATGTLKSLGTAIYAGIGGGIGLATIGITALAAGLIYLTGRETAAERAQKAFNAAMKEGVEAIEENAHAHAELRVARAEVDTTQLSLQEAALQEEYARSALEAAEADGTTRRLRGARIDLERATRTLTDAENAHADALRGVARQQAVLQGIQDRARISRIFQQNQLVKSLNEQVAAQQQAILSTPGAEVGGDLRRQAIRKALEEQAKATQANADKIRAEHPLQARRLDLLAELEERLIKIGRLPTRFEINTILRVTAIAEELEIPGLKGVLGREASQARVAAQETLRETRRGLSLHIQNMYPLMLLGGEQAAHAYATSYAKGIETRESLMVESTKKALAKVIAEGKKAVQQAIEQASSNLFSMGDTLQSMIDQLIDTGPLGTRIERLQDQLNKMQDDNQRLRLERDLRNARRDLATKREQLDPLRSAGLSPEAQQRRARDIAEFLRPEQERLFDTTQALKEFNLEQLIKTLEDAQKRQKKAVENGLDNLIAAYESRRIDFVTFQRRLARHLESTVGSYRRAGNTLGLAFKLRFQAQVQGILDQARAISTPEFRQGVPKPSVVKPQEVKDEALAKQLEANNEHQKAIRANTAKQHQMTKRLYTLISGGLTLRVAQRKVAREHKGTVVILAPAGVGGGRR